jgi:hypothetical protein
MNILVSTLVEGTVVVEVVVVSVTTISFDWFGALIATNVNTTIPVQTP